MVDEKERLPFMMWGKNRHQTPVQALFQDDGTFRTWAIQIGTDDTGRERPVLVEPGRQASEMLWGHDGTDPRRLLVEDTGGAAGHLAVSNYGWDGAALGRFLLEADHTLRGQNVLWDPNAGPAAPIRWRGETAGEATVALYGEDAGGNIDRLVVNPIAVTSTPASQDKRPVEAVAVPAAVADIWVPGLAATVYMDVIFEVVNVDGTNDAILEDFGIDYGNDGGAIDRYFGREIAFPAGEVGQHFGPHRIWGDDAIMAEADFANRLEVHVYIIEEGTAL